jgi:hypothetical protein
MYSRILDVLHASAHLLSAAGSKIDQQLCSCAAVLLVLPLLPCCCCCWPLAASVLTAHRRDGACCRAYYYASDGYGTLSRQGLARTSMFLLRASSSLDEIFGQALCTALLRR